MLQQQILYGSQLSNSVKESLGLFFFKNASENGDKICQIEASSGEFETYANVKIRSVRLAIAMQKRGITPDYVVAVCSSNTLDNTIPIIAALYLNAKVANLLTTSSVRQTKHLLSLIRPKIIFIEVPAINMIEESLEEASFETEIVVFGNKLNYTSFTQLTIAQENERDFLPEEADIEETAIIVFSSGTTGLSKAVSHTHRSFISMVHRVEETTINEAMFHLYPPYALSTLIILAAVFDCGSYRVFCNHPTGEDVFRYIEKYTVEYMYISPYFIHQLAQAENILHRDTSSLKRITCAGSYVTSCQLHKLNELFPTAFTSVVYGLAEVGLVSHCELDCQLKSSKNRIISSGKAGPGVQIKVVNLKTRELIPPDEDGEICIRSCSMMKGYYNQDSSEFFDAEGFLKTGDVGRYDKKGCIYVVDRTKGVFEYQSWSIIPSFIEAALCDHPDIEEAVVFGVPLDDENGQVAAACIVVKENHTLNEDDVDEYLREEVLDRERLRGGVIFLDSLPKTSMGKVNRKEMREFFYHSKSK